MSWRPFSARGWLLVIVVIVIIIVIAIVVIASNLGNKGVVGASVSRLEGAGRGREVSRQGPPRHIGPAVLVHRDALAYVSAAAAEIGGVDQRRADHQRLPYVVFP